MLANITIQSKREGYLHGYKVTLECCKNFVREPMEFALEYAERSVQKLNQLCHDTGVVCRFDSPLEERFYFEWYSRRNSIDLIYQHEVLNGKYRLDFAHPETKTAVELDGYAYHSSTKQFTRDRQRYRDLIRHGWKLFPFSGREVMSDVTRCVNEVLHEIWIALILKKTGCMNEVTRRVINWLLDVKGEQSLVEELPTPDDVCSFVCGHIRWSDGTPGPAIELEDIDCKTVDWDFVLRVMHAAL